MDLEGEITKMKLSAKSPLPTRSFGLFFVVAIVTTFIILVCLLNGPVFASDFDTASYQYDVAASGGGTEELDSFTVSDTDLAVAIFIPGVFMAATLFMLLWAFRGRVRSGDEEEAE